MKERMGMELVRKLKEERIGMELVRKLKEERMGVERTNLSGSW